MEFKPFWYRSDLIAPITIFSTRYLHHKQYFDRCCSDMNSEFVSMEPFQIGVRPLGWTTRPSDFPQPGPSDKEVP